MSTATLTSRSSFASVIPFPVWKGSSDSAARTGTLERSSDDARSTPSRDTAGSFRQLAEVAPRTDAEHIIRRDELVLEYLPMVKAVAVRIFHNLPLHVELEDLVNAGILGLLDAASKFDDSKQVPFKSYAKYRIRGAILDNLREMDWASRDLRRRHKRLEEVTREVSAVTECQPTEVEIAEKMGMSLDRWRQAAIELRMVGLLSASSRCTDNEDSPAPDYPSTTDSHPDVITGHRQLKLALALAMSSLPPRHRQVIHNYYTGGKTMREIGDSMGVNESRVSQIHKVALERMAENLHASGIRSAECVI